jgi:membrane protease YdiL (CAAX protease family)
LRGFRPLGLLAILVIVLTAAVLKTLSAILVLLWAWRSHTPWREIGYVRPKNWIVSLAVGIVVGTALKFWLKAIVMPLLGADPINRAYHYLVGNRAALPGIVFTMIVAAGFGEETVFRGYMFERLGKLFGTGVGAKVSIVLLTSVFGTIFAVTGRIWMLMCAHAAYDLTAVAIIYWNLEADVAHLVFR